MSERINPFWGAVEMIDLQGLSNSARELCKRTGMMIVLQNSSGETVFETEVNSSVCGSLVEIPLSQCTQGFTLFIKVPNGIPVDSALLELVAMRFEPFLKPNQEAEMFRNVMCGLISKDTFLSWLKLMGVRPDMKYRMYLLEFPETAVDEVRYLSENILEQNKGDLLVELRNDSFVLVKSCEEDDTLSAAQELAEALVQTMLAEVGIGDVSVAVSGVYEDLYCLNEAFESVNAVLCLGKKCAPSKMVYIYEALRLESFLSKMPRENLKLFFDQYATENISEAWDDKMLDTVQSLFDNSLNLSETSRQLFLHRNTLVYRLDKIKKLSGLDLRNFEDAVLFKLLMTVDKILD